MLFLIPFFGFGAHKLSHCMDALLNVDAKRQGLLQLHALSPPMLLQE